MDIKLVDLFVSKLNHNVDDRTILFSFTVHFWVELKEILTAVHL
jgi:hypothetical protein